MEFLSIRSKVRIAVLPQSELSLALRFQPNSFERICLRLFTLVESCKNQKQPV